MEAAIASSDAEAFVSILTTCISNNDSNIVIIDDDNKDSGVDTTSLEKLHQLKDLLQKSITIITKNCNDIIKAAATKASSSSSSSSGEAETFLVIEEAQFVEPRGKFKATINKGGLFLEGKQGNLFINWSNFARSACIPSSSSSKKEGEDILVFVLSEPVKLNNKDISNFQWILNKSDKKVVNITFDSNNVSGTEAAIVPKLVRRLTDKSVDIPRPAIFSSKKDKPYLLCHKGIQEGAVYPMKSGVIFVKPLLYIPFNEIASVSAGRGGTQVTTRYVDLIIETADERQYEFTNIERDDLPALNGYVKNYLEERIRHENAMIKEQEIAENDGEGDDDDDDDDDDSEDDEDFHPDGDFDDDGSGSDDDSKNDSNNETEDEDISKENAKPQKDLKESRKSKNPKKIQRVAGKKEIDPKKSKSPKKRKTDIFPKSMIGFVSLVEDEMNITGKRGPSSEIDLVNDNVKKEQKLM